MAKMTQQGLNGVGELAFELVVNLYIYNAFAEMKLGKLSTILEITKSRRNDILRIFPNQGSNHSVLSPHSGGSFGQ